MVSTESIRELAEPVLASAGLELWDVEIARDVVRIMVDRPGGIDLDALTAASSVLSPVLDTHPDVVPEGRYQLEISSPGIERTLRTPDQYQRYIGAEVTVKTSVSVDGARRHRGRLLDARADGVTLEPDDGAGTRLELRYDQIDRARTVLVFGPTGGRPGRGRPATGPSPSDRKIPRRGTATSRATANPKDAG
jgi:ribosome maturation factor RimP